MTEITRDKKSQCSPMAEWSGREAAAPLPDEQQMKRKESRFAHFVHDMHICLRYPNGLFFMGYYIFLLKTDT